MALKFGVGLFESKGIAEDAVNGFLFVSPSLSAMKAELMNWWKDYPTIAMDCTEVWWNK